MDAQNDLDPCDRNAGRANSDDRQGRQPTTRVATDAPVTGIAVTNESAASDPVRSAGGVHAFAGVVGADHATRVPDRSELAVRTFILPIAVELHVTSIGQLDDDRIMDAIMAFPDVIAVHGLPPIERDESDTEPAWAYIEDVLDDDGDDFPN